jgi:hypothetical protein
MTIAKARLHRKGAARKPARRFTAADATRHHPAASLMTRRDRQAWAKSANNALKSGKSIEDAIREGNFTLNAYLDYDADKHAGVTPLYIKLTHIEADITNNRNVIAYDPIATATAQRFRKRDYYSTKLDFSRHPQLLAVAERQRRAAGRSQ